ncbi:MAG: hypothetical protein AAFQ64_08065 [Pseudomonadota bacterium]
MMKFNPLPLALLALIAACDNAQPLIFDPDAEAEVDDATEVTEDETSGSDPASSAIPLTIDEILDEGTLQVDLSASRDARGDVARTEARSGSEGFADEFIINDTDDTLEIDNLAFDGLNIYTRGANVPAAQGGAKLSDLGSIAVYHADIVTPDFLTDNPVDQSDPYVAVYAESDVIIMDEIPDDATPEEIQAIMDAARPRATAVAVRTGAYTGFGFGGFGYDRAGDTVIATTGQATFSGDYAGLRVIDFTPELLVTDGDITIDIDFDDFNEGAGLKGVLSNRQAYLADGRPYPTYTGIDITNVSGGGADPISAADLATLNAQRDAIIDDINYWGVLQLPDLPLVVRGGGETIKDNGEISGEVRNRYRNPASGDFEVYENGFYYAIIAGDTTQDDGGEVAGILKFEAPDNRFEGVVSQETGVFIAER